MEKLEERVPKVGVAIILLKKKERKVLLGLRKNSHGNGQWSFPGGKKEFFETSYEAALRELLEETGLKPPYIEMIDKRPIAVTEDLFSESLDYTTLFLRALYIRGEPTLTEPEKCSTWEWFKWGTFPSRTHIFLPVKNLIKQGYNPFKNLK